MTKDFDKWNYRFLELAEFVSRWSKDPSTKVGAVIVNPKNIVVGMGYNGFPRGVYDDEERYADRETKYKYVVHAEVNAVLNASQSVRGCRIYVAPTLMYPNACPECMKVLIQAGICELWGYENKNRDNKWSKIEKFSQTMLDETGMRFFTLPRRVI